MGAALPVASMALKFLPIAATVGGQLFSGFSGSTAAGSEADSIEAQAELERSEILEEARRQKVQNRKFLARQSVMFVKGGVSLEGSPMLVLEETAEESEKQFAAGKRQAEARFKFGMGKAERVRAQGRGKLLGGILGGAGSGVSMFLKGKQAGMFDFSKIFKSKP